MRGVCEHVEAAEGVSCDGCEPEITAFCFGAHDGGGEERKGERPFIDDSCGRVQSSDFVGEHFDKPEISVRGDYHAEGPGEGSGDGPGLDGVGFVVDEIDYVGGGLGEEHAGFAGPGVVERLEVSERVSCFEDGDVACAGIENGKFVADACGSVDFAIFSRLYYA